MVGVDPTDLLDARSDLQAVVRAFSALPAEQRTILTLVVIEGYSYRDAADTLAIPIGTVMSRLARARAAIADSIKSSENDGLQGEGHD